MAASSSEPCCNVAMAWTVVQHDPWHQIPLHQTEEKTEKHDQNMAATATAAPTADSDYLILPWQVWRDDADAYQSIVHLGLSVPNDGSLELLVPHLARFTLICLDFPVFQDGRSYSLATELRQCYGYQGELRATGELLPDQLHFIWRCGFDSLVIADDASTQKRIQTILEQPMPFTAVYQHSVRGGAPIYRRR